MTLIKSISGIRGTIGGLPGEALTPVDIVKYTAAFGLWVQEQNPGNRRMVIGRDARISGHMVNNIVIGTLQAVGINVIDLGLSTTPTVELMVPEKQAAGGIIITASHNPKGWNALKLLNRDGEFISAEEGQTVLEMADKNPEFAPVGNMGDYQQDGTSIQNHILKILKIPLVDVEAIRARKFKIVVDCVNSTGGISVPRLLRNLGVDEVVETYCDPNGKFPRNPEPIPENLNAIANEVKHRKADLGIVVDPDVDRLALVCEDGDFFGEEYTLVAIADYVLQNTKGDSVSNLSSTQALADVTIKNGGKHHASAVGEVNVVQKMKKTKAVIGGEGNGGVIYPELHYGRDALVGIALFLSHLAKYGKSMSRLRGTYPDYHISKNKIELDDALDPEDLLDHLADKYKAHPTDTTDGLKIIFEKEWVHLRRSNTEDIIRIYAESQNETTAETLAKKLMEDIRAYMKQIA